MELTLLQHLFTDGVYRKDTSILAHITAEKDSAASRFEVYRNNIYSNLSNALMHAYPILCQLVGEEFFRYMAYSYINTHPSHSGNLDMYGHQLAEFLTSFEPIESLPYASDVAQLEWACHRSYMAANMPILSAQKMASVPVEHYEQLYFTCHASCFLLHSAFPLFYLWQVHQPEYQGPIEVDLDGGESFVLVLRQDLRVRVIKLEAAEYHFLCSLQCGQSLLHSYDNAYQHDEHFDMAECLQRHVAYGTFSDFYTLS